MTVVPASGSRVSNGEELVWIDRQQIERWSGASLLAVTKVESEGTIFGVAVSKSTGRAFIMPSLPCP